jgi:hypothetical protein
MKPFLLINTNVAQPPISPVGLEYVGEALVASNPHHQGLLSEPVAPIFPHLE